MYLVGTLTRDQARGASAEAVVMCENKDIHDNQIGQGANTPDLHRIYMITHANYTRRIWLQGQIYVCAMHMREMQR